MGGSMPPAGGSGSWSVPVLHGPSSSDNLVTTLVAWARHRGRDPRAFHLSMVNDGRTLLLKGFDAPSLKDFLRYAEYSSIPALECGRPTEVVEAAPKAPAATEPAAAAPRVEPEPEAAAHPPTLSSSSIQMVIGTAQLLADRSTDVHRSESWVTSMLATPELRSQEVGLLLRMIGDADIDTHRLALAESEPLRREGENLLKVPCEMITETLRAWLGGEAPATAAAVAPTPKVAEGAEGGAEAMPVSADATGKKRVRKPGVGEDAVAEPAPSPPPTIPPAPQDEETRLRVRIFARALDARAQRWTDVAERLRQRRSQGPPGLQGVLEGAVFINEEEGRVAWVVPHSNSALVKALVGYVHESHRVLREESERRRPPNGSWVSPARQETFAALETARRSTQMAARLGVEFRWVILLSTGFNDGKEDGFGLPVGSRPPWEEAPLPPTLPSSTTSTRVSVKKKAAPPPPSLAKFSSSLDEPLESMLERAGVRVSLLRRAAPAPAAAAPVRVAAPTPKAATVAATSPSPSTTEAPPRASPPPPA